MIDSSKVLRKLAQYYAGCYYEAWDGSVFKVQIVTQKASFTSASPPKADETDVALQERVRYETLWLILQKGVELFHDQVDIQMMFHSKA